MNGELNKAKTGLVLGLFMAIAHAAWVIIVGLGVAQGLIDWVSKMHLMENPYIVSDFNLSTAIGLLVMTFVVGYILGWVFAALWNGLKKSS